MHTCLRCKCVAQPAVRDCSRPLEPMAFRNKGRGGARAAPYEASGGGDDDTSVYVGNLPWDVTWKELKDHM